MSRMEYICAGCSQTFTDKEAICEDWRDKKKAFICPNCNAYLGRGNKTREKLTYIFGGISLVVLVIVMLMGVLPALTVKFLIGVVSLICVIVLGVFKKQNTYVIK